ALLSRPAAHGQPDHQRRGARAGGRGAGSRARGGQQAGARRRARPAARRAGAIIIGRTNAPAFSMRIFSDNALHGRTLNPLDPSVAAGGSSGGAGAAVATGIGPIAQGNDIGGSVRIPAYFNGVVGLRVSLGRIPSFNPSAPAGRPIGAQLMSVQGPLTRSVRDARLALAAMA